MSRQPPGDWAPATRPIIWRDVGAVHEMRFEPGFPVRVDDRFIAIVPRILSDGTRAFAAVDDRCPHAGASLASGWLDGDQLVCPLHGWEFDLDTGTCPVGAEWAVQTWPVREVGGRLQLGLWPTPPQPTPPR